MNKYKLRMLTLLGALLLVAAAPAGNTTSPASGLAVPDTSKHILLPFVSKAPACPGSSGNVYRSGPMYQYDTDNPVRPAWNHADKNLALRGYASNPSAFKGFINYGTDDPIAPPQFATLFGPNRVPAFTGAYQVYNWSWADSPNPGSRSTLDTVWAITVLGLQTTPGEALHAPTHGRPIGIDFGLGGSMVIFADSDSLTLHFTREDTAARGYTVHVDNICTDPNLLALYNSLDNSARNTYVGRGYAYNLPGLIAGQVFGTARDNEIRVAIVDTGSFMDPRSCGDWWEIRPNHGCP